MSLFVIEKLHVDNVESLSKSIAVVLNDEYNEALRNGGKVVVGAVVVVVRFEVKLSFELGFVRLSFTVVVAVAVVV